MTKIVSNKIQLEALLESQARKVMEGATKDILAKFKLNYVTKYAYAKGQPKQYPRTFDFREAWVWSKIKESSWGISMEMFNNFQLMQSPSSRGKEPFRHTTFATNSKWVSDSRPHMASYLENLNTDIFLTGNRSGGYWSKFVTKELEGRGLLKIIKKHAKANGFVHGRGVTIS